jgi:hypothetical protein
MNPTLQLLFVGVSLQTYYFYGVGLPVIAIVCLFAMGVLLFATEGDGIRFPASQATAVALGYLVVLFWSLVGLLFYGDVPNPKRFISFPVVIFAALVAVSLLRRFSLQDLVRFYLAVHVAFFYLQFVAFYTTGYTIDYLAPVTGEEQRVFGGAFPLPIIESFFRATGLFNEPGTYATFVAPFVALFERWYAVSAINKRLFWISLLSLFASFSVFGIVFGVLIFVFSTHVRRSHRIAGLAASAVIATPFLYYRFVVRTALGQTTGLEFREVFIQESLNFLATNPLGFVFGSNLLVLDPRAEFAGAFNDIGLLLYLLHFAGPLLTLLLVLAFVYVAVKSDRVSRVALLIILLSKHSPFAPFFPFALVAVFWEKYDRVRRAPSA